MFDFFNYRRVWVPEQKDFSIQTKIDGKWVHIRWERGINPVTH